MPKTKVIPIIISRRGRSDMHQYHQNNNYSDLKLTDKWEDDYGSGNRHGRDYWHARRAFLNSYHFQEQDGFNDKLKRWIKEVNKRASVVITNCYRELSKRKLGLRAFRVKFGLPSSDVVVSMRCFSPWLNRKKELM